VRVRALHPFDLPAKDGMRLQSWLARQVVAKGRFRRRLRLVAAADCSPSADGHLHAVVVLCEPPDWRVVEEASASARPLMPYVPGLLSFREAPIILEALRKLRTQPDVLLVDGQGRAHPRRLGIASHIGLHLAIPVIGVGKSRLVGVHGAPGPRPGDWVSLTDRGERIGVVLTTKAKTKPIFVSVGNRIGLLPAARIALATVGKYRLPEPIRQADLRSRALARLSMHDRLGPIRPFPRGSGS
jgi:deoxyribonuclease V